MKRYALLDTDFISKTHSVQDDGGNHLIDRVMELPEYEFFCHAQIVTELNRYNADVMQKKGMYLGGYRPFGFLPDPNDCHKLILDPVASQYVRLIFDLAMQGNRTGTIWTHLNSRRTAGFSH